MAPASTPIWAPTPEKMQAAIERLVAVARPTKIILFGSQARGDADDHSDVDLLVIKPHVADRYEEIISPTSDNVSYVRSEPRSFCGCFPGLSVGLGDMSRP